MHTSNFDQLFEEVALSLFQDFQNSVDILTFLQKKLPSKFGIEAGVLVNRKKEITTNNYIFFDALSCPKLSIESPKARRLIPANYAYGSLSYFQEINQASLENALQENLSFDRVFEGQSPQNKEVIKPLNIWFAENLAPFLSLNDLEDRLLAEPNPPDLIAVLNSGLLVTLNEQTIQNIFALSQKENAQSFDKAITADLIDIAQKTMQRKYFKIGATAAYKNCFYYYVFLLDLLKHQPLLTDGLSAEMVAIW
ncbi:MAG: hypothetical protein AB8G86_02560 [Saprospiraceae bacterium]